MFANLPKHKLILRTFLLSLTCVFLVLSLVRLKAQGSSTPTVYIFPQQQNVQRGEEVLVSVNISEVSDLYSFQISLVYDNDVLEYQGVSEGSFLNQGGAFPTFKQNPVVELGRILGYAVSRTGTVPGANGSGNLAVFRFLAKNLGTSEIEFIVSGAHQLKLQNSQLQNINTNYNEGKVVVAGTDVPPSSNEAKFNFMAADNKTLRIKNRTRNDNYWAGAISANPGDKIAFNVYYHQGIEGISAKNTKIKLTFPETAQASITLQLSLSADNASTVTDSVKINLASSQTISFSPTAQWYPERAERNPRNLSLTPRNGQIEVLLGEIKGCWEYQGQVIFETQLSNVIPQGSLELTSQIKNITQGSNWAQNATASATDELNFKIELKAKDYNLNNVIIKAQLASSLTYQANSLGISGGTKSTGDLFTNQGLNLGQIKAGQTATVSFKVKVAQLASGQYNLNNYILAQADNISQIQKTNTVNLSVTDCSLTIHEPGHEVE